MHGVMYDDLIWDAVSAHSKIRWLLCSEISKGESIIGGSVWYVFCKHKNQFDDTLKTRMDSKN